MARLLPQQVEELQKTKELLLQKRREYVTACNDYARLTSTTYEGVTDLNNLYDLDQIAIIDSRISRINKILKNCEIIQQESIVDSSKIEIGTFFQATVVDDEETWTAEYQLVEELTDFKGKTDTIPVSIKTPFGKSVYEKEEGQSFTYSIKLPNNLITKFNGTINKIYGLIKEESNVKTK